MKLYLLGICIGLLVTARPSFAQSAMSNPIQKRTQTIMAALSIGDATKSERVQQILQAYLDTQDKIFKERNAAMKAASDFTAQNKELAEARSEKAWDAAAGKFNKLHATFLGKLSSLLTAAQVETVKDVMTENGLQAEYKRFLTLLPNLTEQEKAQVKTYLQEARENAMDAETADMRKQWFIKYRGRANNFLAAAGYDLQKATADLESKKQLQTKAQANK